MKTHVLTHRGLDPSRSKYFIESSREAFTDQIKRGFGLEFDIQFSSDGVPFALHDPTLTRLSRGKDNRPVNAVLSRELLELEFDDCSLSPVEEILALISGASNEAVSALHLKGKSQNVSDIRKLFSALHSADQSRFFVFDVKPQTARILRQSFPELALASSVALPHDIKRYNSAVGGTLISVDEALSLKDVYKWVWLDEWDRTDENGGAKTLYNAEVFGKLRDVGYKIALVTPELHRTSPRLLGGEAHQDACDHETLMVRIKEILALGPDAVCTDFPDEVRSLIQE